ncbi:MAG: hypothetical protein CMN06_02805 [Roseibacillus sp.]|nr:hypothetical protein [Roseibacillus sp.]
MKINFKSLLAPTLAAFIAIGPSIPSTAQEMEVAPLVDGLADLRKLSKKLVALSDRSAAATVSLVSTGGGGAGSGVIVSEEGLVLTAAHVVASLSDDVIVIFPDGKRVKAEKLGGDYDRDAAMVRITEKGTYPFVKVGESKGLRRNEWCVAFGHPGGFDSMRTPPVRLGRVLGNGQFVTTDCAVVGGDSGGPLFDLQGEVIGIHSNIGSTLSENRHVPIGVFLGSWDEMVAGKRTGARFAGGGQQVDPERPVLGINLAGPAEGGGVSLEGVMENSPAENAGLQAGDVVVKINEEGVDSPEELIEVVGEYDTGDTLKISYRRGGEESEVEVKLARLGDLLGTSPRGEESDEEESEEKNGAEDADGPAEQNEAEKPEERGAGMDLEKLLRESLRRGNLDLDEEALRNLGGMAELERALREMADSIGPEALRDMLQMEIQSGPDDFFASAMESLQPVTSKAARSVVSVEVEGKPAALGTVVSDEGHILTKNVETLEGNVSRKGQDGKISLKLIKRFPKRDLALYQGSPDGLEPVKWVGKKKSPVGTLLTAPDPDGAPLGIGLVSVLPRALGEIGFLGIQAGEGEDGVAIVRIVNGSPAEDAGLKADDIITHVDGLALKDPFAFGSKIRTYRAGDKVEFTYQRGGEVDKVKVKLASRPQEQSSDRFRRMNEMSGPLSERLSGFPLALQHDMPISPAVCGGPLLDLQGRCLGVNVSRAGRVKTLAIPASDIRKLLASVDEMSAKTPGEPPVAGLPSGPSPSDKDDARDQEIDKVLEELRNVGDRLQELEKRLELLRK